MGSHGDGLLSRGWVRQSSEATGRSLEFQAHQIAGKVLQKASSELCVCSRSHCFRLGGGNWRPGEETSEDSRKRAVAVGKNEGGGQYTFRKQKWWAW